MATRTEPNLTLADLFHQFVDAYARLEAQVGIVDRTDLGRVTCLHWSDSGRRGGRFRYEFLAMDCAPADMIGAVSQVRPAGPHFVSDFHAEPDQAFDRFKALGYQLDFREPVMAIELGSDQSASSVQDSFDVTDGVTSAAIVDAFTRADSNPRPITRSRIDDPQTIIKAIFINDAPVATGKGILAGDVLYVTDIGTLPDFRGRGLGRAIMQSLHVSASAAGARCAVLSSTEMGVALYRSLAYQQIGIIDYFEPLAG